MRVVVYALVVVLGAFIAIGGPQPTAKASQNGSSVSTRKYGQPFAFHTSQTYIPATGKSYISGGSAYKTGEIIALIVDISLWSGLIWLVVRMAEQRPVLFWRKHQAAHVTKQSVS